MSDDHGIDVAAHNTIVHLTQLYGRLLAEKERQLAQVSMRLKLAQEEVVRLMNYRATDKGELHSTHGDRQDGQWMAGSRRAEQAAEQERSDEGGGGRTGEGIARTEEGEKVDGRTEEVSGR